MSDLNRYLTPTADIPWESAAAFFVVTKEATIDKTAQQPAAPKPQNVREMMQRMDQLEASMQKRKGIFSGIRGAAREDVAHAARVKRTRGARVGKELGTAAGALAGLIAGRKGKAVGRIGGAAIGGLLGRGAGKTIGEEIDRARTIKRYNRPEEKKAELEKRSGLMRPEQPTAKELISGRGPKARAERAALREKMRAECPVGKKIDEELGKKVAAVRHMWKLAQGEEQTSLVEGMEGATPSPVPVDVAGLDESVSSQNSNGKRKKNGQLLPAWTPEDLQRMEAEAALQEEDQLDQAAMENELEYYRQLAEEASTAAEEMSQQLQQMQMQMDQSGQMAQMAQMQADQATQQATMQAQQDAQEKQMLSEESLAKGESLMQLRQAMQAYRENLQQLALQDPTAAAGPSPMEQGMPTSPEEAAMAEQMGAEPMGAEEMGGMPPEAGGAPPEMLAEEQAAPPSAPPKKSPPKKEEKKEGGGNSGVTVNVEKKSSALPELLKESSDFSTRMIGAAIGAAGGAGLQALSDRPGTGGMSMKERVLRAKFEHYQQKKNPTVFDKHMMNITRAMADTAKVNREHPGSAAAMAAIGGAVAGATLAPTVGKMFRR
jgi:hypothetical protein